MVVGIIKQTIYIECDCVSPIRKSDHSLLSIDCKLQTANVKIIIVKCNYNKGVDDGMRQSIQINWKEFLSSPHEIDTMWMVYKQKFRDSNLSLYTGYKIHGERKGG